MTLRQIINQQLQDEAAKSKLGDFSESSTTKSSNAKNIAESTIRVKPRLLYDKEPDATDKSIQTFEILESCTYQYRDMGSAVHGELMSCECRAEYKDGINFACGANSDCINRMTSIECVNQDCDCGIECQNQRFQKRSYAAVSVFQTDLKGYGLRADENIKKHQFVYEYIGEVIDESKFRKRMSIYDEQGKKHFYFMMLQAGEFIDATRKGCIARFCNHSCAPNCFVDKWIVNSKLRMGIFSSRAIAKGEELTFDYNVDRYGAEPQVCHCGEPNCVGFIGGSKQTTETPLTLSKNVQEALDIDNFFKKSRRKMTELEEIDLLRSFKPKPVDEDGVVKIMSVLLQSKEQWIIYKLINRISESEDSQVQRKVMKLHGYQILGSVLDDWKNDAAIAIKVLKILSKWPKITRNKISSSKIEPTVKYIASSGQDEASDLAKNLLEEWNSLKMAYRIPRRRRDQVEKDLDKKLTISDANKSNESSDSEPNQSGDQKLWSFSYAGKFRPSNGWQRTFDAHKTFDPQKQYHRGSSQWDYAKEQRPESPARNSELKIDLQVIIDEASRQYEAQAEEQKRKEEEERNKLTKEVQIAQSFRINRKKSSDKFTLYNSADLAAKFKALLAHFVPNAIAKYQDKLGKEEFKKRAKEIVLILVDKQAKRGFKNIREIDDSHKVKIKKWAYEYMDKALTKSESRKKRKVSPGSSTKRINVDQQETNSSQRSKQIQ